MKIRITQAGWAGFSDYLGAILFRDSISVEDVSKADMQALAGIVEIETVAEGDAVAFNPSIAQVILDTVNVAATFTDAAASAPVDPKPVARAYTRAELATIADNTGIKGLRVISDPMGLKGTSIVDLIGRIVDWQVAHAPAVVEAPVVVDASQADRDAAAQADHDAQMAADAAAVAAQEALDAIAAQANIDALAAQAAADAEVVAKAAADLQKQTDDAIAAAAAAAGNPTE